MKAAVVSLTHSNQPNRSMRFIYVLTGVLFVIKNFAVFVFSPEFIIVLNLSHLGLVMTFMLVNPYCLIFKKQWTKAR